MIPHGVEIFIGLAPIDLRWGFDRLAGIVEERIGRNVRSGALFVFFGKRRTAVKIVFFDKNGLCLFYKRLDKGTFRPPQPLDDDSLTAVIDERVLNDLLDGLDIAHVQQRTSRTKMH